MKRSICFFEDERVDCFYPLSLSHTIAELQCGILSLGDKWSIRLPQEQVSLLTRHYLAEHLRACLSRPVNDLRTTVADQIIFINPRFVADNSVTDQIMSEGDEKSYVQDDALVAMTVASGTRLIENLNSVIGADSTGRVDHQLFGLLVDYARHLPQVNVKLRSVRHLWDIVHHNSSEIEADFDLLIPELSFSQMFDDSEIDEDVLIYNVDDVYVGKSCQIDGQVVIDARSGPVYIGEKVKIAPQTRVEGPAYIGDGCQLVGGNIRGGCSFGTGCRIGGEVEESIFHGYSNKYHDGFIGHAYVGEWVNLGALTTNSDLKNNYGNIKVELPTGMVDTGLNKVGSFIGDHTKTGIGTLLTTGMVVGFGVNLFGGGLAGGRALPSLVWGGKEGFVEHRVEQAIDTGRAVLARRNKKFEEEDTALFKTISELTATYRQSFLKTTK
jgi:UDP-N-acetylglucosamine diphosphorylase/glucosamine-1-phosphate N-acetyltransferase